MNLPISDPDNIVNAMKRDATRWDILAGGEGYIVLRTRPGEQIPARVFSSVSLNRCKRWAQEQIRLSQTRHKARKAG